KGLVSVDILDNCGAACFLGFSAILAVGRRQMLGFGCGIGGLLLAVILYLFLGPALGLNSDPALSIMNKTLADVQDVVNARLALFGPSLCLAISSLVLVAWTFLRKFKETSWSV